MNIRFLDDGDQCFLCGTARLEKAWKIAPMAELRNLEIDLARARFPEPLAVAVSAIATIFVPLAVFGTAALLDLEVHNALDDVGKKLADDVVTGALFNELRKCHTSLGHLRFLSRKVALQKQPSPGATMAALML